MHKNRPLDTYFSNIRFRCLEYVKIDTWRPILVIFGQIQDFDSYFGEYEAPRFKTVQSIWAVLRLPESRLWNHFWRLRDPESKLCSLCWWV